MAFKMKGMYYGEGTGSALKKADSTLAETAYQVALGGTNAKNFGKGGSFVKDALPTIVDSVTKGIKKKIGGKEGEEALEDDN